ncbi:MAG: hypothetical protein GEV06_07245 [Luteitalea sp.]|nr:hypothetical protein [Luteitalea sp.]
MTLGIDSISFGDRADDFLQALSGLVRGRKGEPLGAFHNLLEFDGDDGAILPRLHDEIVTELGVWDPEIR